jgi:hypothetical protein
MLIIFLIEVNKPQDQCVWWNNTVYFNWNTHTQEQEHPELTPPECDPPAQTPNAVTDAKVRTFTASKRGHNDVVSLCTFLKCPWSIIDLFRILRIFILIYFRQFPYRIAYFNSFCFRWSNESNHCQVVRYLRNWSVSLLEGSRTSDLRELSKFRGKSFSSFPFCTRHAHPPTAVGARSSTRLVTLSQFFPFCRAPKWRPIWQNWRDWSRFFRKN